MHKMNFMKLILQRVALQATYTQGYLFIDNRYFCDTLEAKVFSEGRVRKDSRLVAIPKGKYQIVMHYSNRYKRFVPTIFEYGKCYMFQKGSKPNDAHGIIVGKNAPIGWIEESENYLQRLISRIHHAIRGGERVILEIR